VSVEDADRSLMHAAIVAAERGLGAGQAPFGCALSLHGRAPVVAHNRVAASGDPTTHAEIEALRLAAARTGREQLRGATVACSAEPCPMCASALFWAGVGRIVYAASIADLVELGIDQQALGVRELVTRIAPEVALRGGVEREASLALFRRWGASH
jgi:tRNA(Arg) A34 adenosine deaminase TadA